MFSGIIDSIGTIASATPKGDLRVAIHCGYDTASIAIGESIAINGACMTVVEKSKNSFSVDVSAESVSRTGAWSEGAKVNLERSLKIGDRLNGHLVTGHVDGTAKIINVKPEGDSHMLQLEAPQNLARYIAEKGSITLDGVALTVNKADKNRFEVNIIPHTWKHTTLSARKPGDAVNIEIDPLARYVERLMQK